MLDLSGLFPSDAAASTPFSRLTFPPKPEHFKRESDVEVDEALEARIRTARFMELAGIEDAGDPAVEQQAARNAFGTLTGTDGEKEKMNSLTLLSTPESVRHLVAMLTAHDWNFVERAAQIRGYTVAKIMDETVHPDARIRLRALELMGKITEVGLFTERVRVEKTVPDEELDRKIKDKLAALQRLRSGEPQVVDVEPK